MLLHEHPPLSSQPEIKTENKKSLKEPVWRLKILNRKVNSAENEENSTQGIAHSSLFA